MLIRELHSALDWARFQAQAMPREDFWILVRNAPYHGIHGELLSALCEVATELEDEQE
jgi:hypothetical protein